MYLQQQRVRYRRLVAGQLVPPPALPHAVERLRPKLLEFLTWLVPS